MAQPPSTGRSTPVIWRETSLPRNRQALATSWSVETRLTLKERLRQLREAHDAGELDDQEYKLERANKIDLL